jgi:hypothetical protein
MPTNMSTMFIGVRMTLKPWKSALISSMSVVSCVSVSRGRLLQ